MLGNTNVTKIIFQSAIIQVVIFLIYNFSLNSNQQNNTVCTDMVKNLSVLFNNWVNLAVYSRLMAKATTENFSLRNRDPKLK